MKIFDELLAQADSQPGFEAQARSLLEESEAKLVDIQSQMKDLTRRGEEQEHVGALRYVLAPIRRLPAEMLTEIFSRVDTGDDDESPIKLAIRLSAVCGYWRQLVLHTPRLWTTVVIKLQLVKLSVEYRNMVKELLERSSPHPIDISFYSAGRKRPEQLFFAPVMDAVLSVAHRWGGLYLDFDILPALQTIASLPLPHLTSMELNLGYGYVQQPSQSPSFFLDAARLTRVSLCMSDFSLLPMPWSQLTDLSLSNHTTQGREFLDIIPQCSSLVHLQLVVIAWHNDDLNIPVPAHVVLLPNLLDLELHPAQPNDDLSRWEYTFAPFFAHFGFPALTKLSITMETAETIILGDAFPEFLRRSPHLDSLSISHCDMDDEDMDGILENVPSLTTLDLFVCADCVNNTFFERLTYLETDLTPIASRLHTIRARVVGPGASEEAVLAMLRSRWWTNAALRALPAPPRVARWRRLELETRTSAHLDDPPVHTMEFKRAVRELKAEAEAEGLALWVDFI
ncbi:hypothetical protein C8F01DRAFT_1024457 [Mycena amicta]|nr:hypothetical protein C8F01DRAFT_1024457 [Mycena amicta]